MPTDVDVLPLHIDLGDRRVTVVDASSRELFAQLARLAPGMVPILLYGETGAGKEVAARAAHYLSPRRDRPFLPINCAAIPDGLVEAELFGHERGAFTGAIAARAGVFEAAAGGTVLLDEIGELPLSTQARLLRTLDGNGVLRLGSTVERAIDVRIVAATNRDLEAEVAAGRFRSDLYFRLRGATLTVPALRKRPRDLPLLAAELLAAARLRLGRDPATLSPAALQALARHPWPGNVRELKHVMEYAALQPAAGIVEIEQLPPAVVAVSAFALTPDLAPARPPEVFRSLAEEVRALERTRMLQALASADGVQTRAAALLHMPRRTFVAKMKQYRLGDLRRRRLG